MGNGVKVDPARADDGSARLADFRVAKVDWTVKCDLTSSRAFDHRARTLVDLCMPPAHIVHTEMAVIKHLMQVGCCSTPTRQVCAVE